jgi:hypothetical protein
LDVVGFDDEQAPRLLGLAPVEGDDGIEHLALAVALAGVAEVDAPDTREDGEPLDPGRVVSEALFARLRSLAPPPPGTPFRSAAATAGSSRLSSKRPVWK